MGSPADARAEAAVVALRMPDERSSGLATIDGDPVAAVVAPRDLEQTMQLSLMEIPNLLCLNCALRSGAGRRYARRGAAPGGQQCSKQRLRRPLSNVAGAGT